MTSPSWANATAPSRRKAQFRAPDRPSAPRSYIQIQEPSRRQRFLFPDAEAFQILRPDRKNPKLLSTAEHTAQAGLPLGPFLVFQRGIKQYCKVLCTDTGDPKYVFTTVKHDFHDLIRCFGLGTHLVFLSPFL